MAKQAEITGVPAVKLEISSENMKNLAGWIARYHSMGLTIEDVGANLYKILKRDELVCYEPSLKGWCANGGDDDLEPNEFTVSIDDFVIHQDSYANLCFVFMPGYCTMYIYPEWHGRECINEHLTKRFAQLGIEPLFVNDSSRDMSWQEADEIIRAYLELQNIPAPPK